MNHLPQVPHFPNNYGFTTHSSKSKSGKSRPILGLESKKFGLLYCLHKATYLEIRNDIWSM